MADDEPNIFDEPDEPPVRRRYPKLSPYIPLQPAPEKAPPLRQPSFLGGLMGYKPTTSLGEQVGRYYKNAGGLDRAVNAAQEAQKRRDPKVLDGLLWPKWEKGQVNKQFPVDVSPSDDPDVSGSFFHTGPKEKTIWVSNSASHPQATLEHEASHGAYVPSWDARKDQHAASMDSGAWVRPHGGHTSDFERYLADPAEVDVRLAEIKRRYAHHTGNLVETPEDAQKAWDWWSSYSRNLEQSINEGKETQFERPDEEPTMSRDQFDFYDSLPPQMKQQMLHRMPELVDRGNAIRSLVRQMG